MTGGVSNPRCPAQMCDPVVAQCFCVDVREGTFRVTVSVKPAHDKMDVFITKQTRPAFTYLKNSMQPALVPRASIDESRIGVGVIP